MSFRIKLPQLQTYQAIMLTGSITAAAQRIHITQPAASKQLVALEDAIGFRLFDRTSGGRMIPTTLGLEFFRHIEGTLVGIEHIPSVAQDLIRAGQARLRLGATPPLMNSDLVGNVLRSFVRSYPSLKFTIETRSRRDIEEWVANGQIDIGLALLPADNPLVETIPLLTTQAVAAVPLNSELAKKKQLTHADLTGAKLILPTNQLLRARIDEQMEENGLQLVADIDASSALTACKLASDGLGVAICDPFSPDSFSPRKLSILGWSPRVELTYGVLVPARRERTKLEKQLIDELFKHAALWGDPASDGH